MPLQIISRMLMFSFAFVSEDTVDYQKQVRHVLQDRCVACHGALRQEGGLRLDTAAAAIKGGDSGAAIQPGKVAESALLERIAAQDLSVRMPPEGEPLKPEEMSAIRLWIEQGANAPADEVPESDPLDHWAFQSPVRPVVPAAENPEWAGNPIDGFIAAMHLKKGLRAQPAADRRTWLRRVSLDLTGLPPTLSEMDSFISDQSPEAFDKVVDRLLASPQYGERWGRHWMDIWRYSDWWGLGAEVRNSQKHIRHWRDWIIESHNADKPYDQMLREMLAADELYPNDLQALRASGFLARQYFKFNRTSWLDETVEHVSKSMLGLTFNCAKCHDHKYDPFSQREYYQLRAIFEPYQIRTDAVAGELDFEKDGIPRAFDCNLDAPTYVHRRGDDRNPDLENPVVADVPAFLKSDDFSISPVSLPAEAWQPGLRAHVLDAHLKGAEQRLLEAHKMLEAAVTILAEAEKRALQKPDDPPSADEQPQTLVEDDFATEKPDMWEQHGGAWTYQDQKLIQSQTGTARAALRLKQQPPADFQATLRYTPTGGDMWKSVGVRFDCIGDDGDEVMIYLSSYAAGPKSQVSFKNKSNQAYPGEAAESRPVNLNEPHEMTIRVRGNLVNVIVDGKPSIAYRLPAARRPGNMELVAFDATAEFLSFTLSTLPASLTMTDAPGKPTDSALPVEQAGLLVTAAEKRVAVAEAEIPSIYARANAQRSRVENPDQTATADLIAAAVKAERNVAALQAEAAAIQAELSVLQATPEKKTEAESALAAARNKVEESRKAIDTPGDSFTLLVGSLKTAENNLESEESRRKPFPSISTGRRTALAKWMTDPRHPLPARVAVNHLWARHFGRGLVPTVFDFGRKGTPPSHPELLDWLAVEFVESGWSMKHMHRLIVLSQTYRMTSSTADAAPLNLTIDTDDRYYWRRNPVRMEAQVVRDSLLSLAGELDLTMGGPSIPVADEVSRRRSLYFVHSHNEHQNFLSMFDDASVLECYRRAESIVPQQALAMVNSPLARQMAEKITDRIESMQQQLSVQQKSSGPQQAAEAVSDERRFIRLAFVTVLATEPSEAELAASEEAMRQFMSIALSSGNAEAQKRGRINFVQALLNHNDFVTVR